MTAIPVKIALPFFLSACVFTATVSVAAQPSDAFVQGEGKETVQATCTRCHSATLVTQNSGSEDVWLCLLGPTLYKCLNLVAFKLKRMYK